MNYKDRYRMPAIRPLRVYAFDPSAGRKPNNYMTVRVDYEDLEPGPVGRQIAVIDYDASNELFYEAVDLDHPAVLMSNGLDPSESDPRFHQQMVYAIARETIRRFEFALGRPIRWRTQHGRRRSDPFHKRLRIFPHAFQQANAFYDPDLGAVLFGYFPATDNNAGELLPGQTIFTCLSHDIVAHEMTHAIIDGQREFLTDATGPDAAAFHEAFADIVALLQHFTYADALLDTINRTGGLIYKTTLDTEAPKTGDQPSISSELPESNLLVGLAREFGKATATGDALRSAIGVKPNSKDIETVMEPHLRGAILVSAVFDAYFTMYVKSTRDLMRIARAGEVHYPAGDLHPDLAKRLASEASRIAGIFLNICVRAIDYLPPVDLHLGEFLRAIITADGDLVPDDPLGFRAELIKAFRLRGIIPKGVTSYSEEALRWRSPSERNRTAPRCKGLDYRIVTDTDTVCEKENDSRSDENRKALYAYAVQNPEALGLDPNRPIQTHSYHPIYRIIPAGKLVVDFAVEFLQQSKLPLDPNTPDSPMFTFRGGSTVIFDHCGDVRYVIEKSIRNQARLQQQRGFHLQRLAGLASAPYQQLTKDTEIEERLNFQLIHSSI